ncbi:MAG: TraB/GumN family protein [Desulfurivibrionaceae bacterium]
MKKVLLAIILALTICTQALAESSVWKAQKGDSVLFLGGTFHLLRPSDFPLPPEFEKAYQASNLLVFETDINGFNNPATQQKLMAQAVYADGSSIAQHLSPKTYSQLSDYCAAMGIPLEIIKRFKPSIISVTMTTLELAKFGVIPDGVDTFMYQLASRDQKRTEGLETIDEQIRFLATMGDGNEDAFITYFLRDIASIKQDYEAMVAAWKQGDIKKLDALFVAELKTKMPKLYKELLSDRNKKWLSRIEAYHNTPEKEFILVGAGHLVGADGLLEALKQKGYTVKKL